MKAPVGAFELHVVTRTDDDQYALGGVKFYRGKNGEPIAIATDKHRLIAATWKEDDPSGDMNAIVPAAVCKQVIDVAEHVSILARDVEVSVNESGRTATIAAAGEEHNVVLGVTLLTGRFPADIPSVFPDVKSAATVQLDVKLLEKMLAVFREMGVKHATMAVVDYDTAVTITGTARDGVSVAGIIQPMVPEDGTTPEIGWVLGGNPDGNSEAPQDAGIAVLKLRPGFELKLTEVGVRTIGDLKQVICGSRRWPVGIGPAARTVIEETVDAYDEKHCQPKETNDGEETESKEE